MKGQKGFTLIELLIVVAIIGVLSAIAIPAYKEQAIKSDIASGIATARSLLTNTDLYIQENGKFPAHANIDKIGASATMSSLGAIALAPDSASAATGTITFTYGAKSKVNTSTAVFTRAASGWSCAFTNNSSAQINTNEIKGCS